LKINTTIAMIVETRRSRSVKKDLEQGVLSFLSPSFPPSGRRSSRLSGLFWRAHLIYKFPLRTPRSLRENLPAKVIWPQRHRGTVFLCGLRVLCGRICHEGNLATEARFFFADSAFSAGEFATKVILATEAQRHGFHCGLRFLCGRICHEGNFGHRGTVFLCGLRVLCERICYEGNLATEARFFSA
jgi:hypothetical protein